MHSSADSAKQQYAAAGVDIDAAERAKQLIKPLARSTARPGYMSDIGFFGAFFQVQGYKEPILVSSTDSVGTKVLIAIQMGKLDTVGKDIVNHCVNDIFVGGADPLFFLDYIGLGHLVPEEVEQIVKGLAEACKESNCALIGGETAQMPALYKPGDFDLVGFIVGAVEKSGIIDGSKITAGDAIIGIPSSGLHTNGYSLARRVLNTEGNPKALSTRHADLGRTLGEALLEPHRSYYHAVKPVIQHVKGMAHITGGGLPGNVPRVLPKGVAATFDRAAWVIPPLFRMIQKAGAVNDEEMFKVFNMGIGMTVFCAPQEARTITDKIPDARIIGRAVAQSDSRRVIINHPA